MKSHHIFARSWYEYGSKTKNAGTFTVELADGIFGEDADHIIYDKLNPMCAAVPEKLAPLNSGQSLFRIFHLRPGSTIVSRSWFVTDDITNRGGMVSYSFGLIFSGDDNTRFLRYPAKAFSSDAFEPYESFAARVNSNPDAPSVVPHKFVPQGEDYSQPIAITRDEWERKFGFGKDLFVKYYSHLCGAICGKDNAKLAVILPENIDGERFILATLNILPMFMKVKFGATSKWTGMMDGSAGRAANGLHLLCYRNEMPSSGQEFPIIDLTGSFEHKNLNTEPQNYAAWVWDNFDKSDILLEFERFLAENYARVLDRMPFEIVENCFRLREISSKPINVSAAQEALGLIYNSFSKLYTKYPFIKKLADTCLNKLLAVSQALLMAEDGLVRVVCYFAANGDETAKSVVYKTFENFNAVTDLSKLLSKLSIVLSYYSGLLSQPSISAKDEMCCCEVLLNFLNCESKEAAEISRNTILKYCFRKRNIALEGKEDSDKAFDVYRDTALAFYSGTDGAVPDNFFKIPEAQNINSAHSKAFFNMECFDMQQLRYTPDLAHIKTALPWTFGLREEEKKELYRSYYDKIGDKRDKYIAMLEMANPRELRILTDSDPSIRNEVVRVLCADFEREWGSEERHLAQDTTWELVDEWLGRLRNLQLESDREMITCIRKNVDLNKGNLSRVVLNLSPQSMVKLHKLYKNSREVEYLRRIDDAEKNNEGINQIVTDWLNDEDSSTKPDKDVLVSRIRYWQPKRDHYSVEYALVITVLETQGDMFIAEDFLSLCKSNGNSAAKDAVNIFKAAVAAEKYVRSSRYIYAGLSKHIRRMLEENNCVKIFTSADARDEFDTLKHLSRNSAWCLDIGRNIAEGVKRIASETGEKIPANALNVYYRSMSYGRYGKSEDEKYLSSREEAALSWIIGLSVGFALLGILFVCISPRMLIEYPPHYHIALWSSGVLSVLIVITTVFSLISISRK